MRWLLVEHQHEEKLLKTFGTHMGDESEIVEKLDQPLTIPPFLIQHYHEIHGKDVIRNVRTRINQNVFRKIILQIYCQTCCVSNLDIPTLNRASHIIPWAEMESIRMDPRNGLCLSATYDAAFDRNLISLDDDYRIILSSDIKDHYTGESVKDYFHSKEGTKITLPSNYVPKQEYLEAHRAKGSF
jgi:putative restriction endonuclease